MPIKNKSLFLEETNLSTISPDAGLIIKGKDMSWEPNKRIIKKTDEDKKILKES